MAGCMDPVEQALVALQAAPPPPVTGRTSATPAPVWIRARCREIVDANRFAG
jgi:hypothetical protein